MTETRSEMSLEHLPDVSSTPLAWRRKLAALPRALGYGLLRLLRIEFRNYLTIDGKVVARFVSQPDTMDFMRWLHQTHTAAFDYGHALGREYVANHGADAADAGQPGTA